MPVKIVRIGRDQPTMDYPLDGPTMVFQDAAEADAIIATLPVEPGVKWQMRRADPDGNWPTREHRRMLSGEYQPVPWARESWWRYVVENNRRHFAHVAQKNPGLISYTENAEKGSYDIQTMIKPGKYLAKYATSPTPSQIAEYAAAFDPTEYGELIITQDATEIRKVYLSGPYACMSKTEGDFVSGKHHPTEVYAGPDLALAYLKRNGSVTGRTIVWPEKKLFTRMYGDNIRLTWHLEKDGYEYGSIDGARIRRIPLSNRHGHKFVAPYVDNIAWARDDGEFLVLDEANGAWGLKSANGGVFNAETCANCKKEMRAGTGKIVWSSLNNTVHGCKSCTNEMVKDNIQGYYIAKRDVMKAAFGVMPIFYYEAYKNEFTECLKTGMLDFTSNMITYQWEGGGFVTRVWWDNNYEYCEECGNNYPRHLIKHEDHKIEKKKRAKTPTLTTTLTATAFPIPPELLFVEDEDEEDNL